MKAVRAPIAALALLIGGPTFAHSQAMEDHNVIVRAGAPALKGSRFYHLGELQAGLNRAIAACGLDRRAANPIRQVIVDGNFGRRSHEAVRAVRGCDAYAVPGEPVDDAVTVALWSRLVPAYAPPDAVDRGFILRLTHEGTDYDHLEWNYTDIDPNAFGTWGPDGATFGAGGEIQSILSAVERSHPTLIEDAFARAQRDNAVRRSPISASQRTRCAGVSTLPTATTNVSALRAVLPLRRGAAGEALLPVFCDDARAGVWERAFVYLGEDTRVRDGYNTHYTDQLRGYVQAGFSARPAGQDLTEIDVAYFLDGGVQLGSRQRTAPQREALANASAAETASAALRRLVIARRLFAGSENECIPPLETQPVRIFCDRLGRDAAFIIDLAPIAERERRAWERRSGLRASDVGLTEKKMDMPDHFLPVLRSR